MTCSKQAAYGWKKSEIHCHTNHSDGFQTVEELVSKAKELDISYLAITDHNTMSATERIEELEKTYGIHLIRGIEWTTFYGHMLTLGYDHLTAINWSNVGPTSIEDSIKEVKKEGAIVGIAHPYQIGAPFCTGCYWEYEMLNLDHYDFIEVWNGEDPHRSKKNKLAFEKWTELLNHGAKIAATCGRDWHRTETTKKLSSLYLYLPDNATTNDVKRAIKNGHSYISIGPKIEMVAEGTCVSGDTISLFNQRSMKVQLGIFEYNDNYTIVLDSNVGAIYRSECEGTFNKEVHVQTVTDTQQITWLRLLIYSSRKELIAFTNPIYVEV
ncbi:CehA/McbA family metallohydrolase [Lysinibacillus sphaericus]|uniref:CehA/McbA family metallohydrolase n=1 Tax=Lysinibacillus sphaericus TaxID=1421 RepID=UPI003F7AAA45